MRGGGGGVLPCEKSNYIGHSPGVQDVNLTIFSHQAMYCSTIYPYLPMTGLGIGMFYSQVNALSERIIRIYLHEFTNNERENSLPHEAAEFIASEPVQVKS